MFLWAFVPFVYIIMIIIIRGVWFRTVYYFQNLCLLSIVTSRFLHLLVYKHITEILDSNLLHLLTELFRVDVKV